MDDPQGLLPHISSLLGTGNIVELSAMAATSFVLIAAAEIGDKSKLVAGPLAIQNIEPLKK